MKIAALPRAVAICMALSGSALLATEAQSWADPPRVCYVTSGGGESVVIGDGFDNTSQVVVWGDATTATDLQNSAGDPKGPVLPPASPPAGARVLSPVNVTSDQVLDVVLPHEPVALWIKTAAGISPPRLVNSPEIWLATDDEPAPGDQMRLFGRNFCPGDPTEEGNRDKMVVFRSALTGKSAIAQLADLSEQDWEHTDDHVIGLLVPKGLEAGLYDIFVHSADSSAFGWSAPYRVDVVAHRSLAAAFSRPDQPSPQAVSVVRVHGAFGDGVHDDTQAIQSALDRVAAAGGGVALLPPGEYAVTRTLHIEPGAFLRGSGTRATSIVVSPSLPMQGGYGSERRGPSYDKGFLPPMIWIETKSGVSDLSMVGGPGAQIAIYICANGISDDVSIVRTNITTPERMFRLGSGDGYQHMFGITVMTDARHLTIAGCHIRCGEPVWLDPQEHYGCTITDNTFEAYPRQGSDNVGLLYMSHAIIEDNDFIGGARALGSRAYGDCWVFNNRVSDDGGWANAEEMFFSEWSKSLWGGSCESASSNTIQAQDANWSPGQFAEEGYFPNWVYIKLGKGFGQMRRVTANTADTLTVDTPWDIVPDSTTRFSILPFNYHNLYINDQARSDRWRSA
jgi:hypothetical protein